LAWIWPGVATWDDFTSSQVCKDFMFRFSVAGLAALDLAASSALTRQELHWTPTGPDLLTDLRQRDWTAE